jgi:hypothetical protein
MPRAVISLATAIPLSPASSQVLNTLLSSYKLQVQSHPLQHTFAGLSLQPVQPAKPSLQHQTSLKHTLHIILLKASEAHIQTATMDFGGGGIEVGGNAGFPLEQWFFETPVCTRYWTTAIVATSVLVQCKVLSPFHLFFTVRSVFDKHQVSFSL